MGQEPRQGRGSPSGRKTRQASPMEWEAEGGGREAYGVATEPSRVRVDGGGREAYGVAETPGGDRQGVQGGVDLSQGIDTPGVDAFLRGDEPPGVDTKGDGVTWEDRQGRVGDGNPPTTRASADSGNNGMARGPRTMVPPRPSDTAKDDDSAGPLPWQSKGADGARPENSMHPRRKYGLLAPEEPEKGRANAGPW